ncbi:MAG: hypothetical protein U5N10_18615 [Gemmobacter sp.]|nr:hypothetical protein [Gemmobacter sp.]
MLVEFDLPEVHEPSAEFSSYWIRYIFVSSPSQDRTVNALASTYMRLVEGAIIEYRLASTALREVWSDHTAVQLRKMHRAISHFESCVTNMHRAISTYRRLRNHPTRDPMSATLVEPKPGFVSDKVATPIRNVRDAIHHLEEKLMGGEIRDGTQIALAATGPEVPHPHEAGQTIKTIDRLSIGDHDLLFREIARSLGEMEAMAIKIAQFDPRIPQLTIANEDGRLR